MRIALFQMDTVWQEKKRNVGKMERAIRDAKLNNVSVLVLPEMFSTGFSMGPQSLGEEINKSDTLARVSELAKQNSITIVGSIIEKRKNHFYNTGFVIDKNGALISTYSKIHLFPLSKENENYCAGKSIETFELEGVTCALAICYDLRFPELFRELMKRDVQVIFVPANWPESRKDHWLTLLRARAIENQFFVVGVNRVGKDPLANYGGNSIVLDPWGDIVARAKTNSEELIVADIDLGKLKTIRETYPFLKSTPLL